MSLLNRLKISIEEEVWQRFPYVCSYCNSCPCTCTEIKPEERQKVTPNSTKRPRTMGEFQDMFNKIYPAAKRTIDRAGAHLSEEIGESSEAVWNYRGDRNEEEFKEIILEAADYFSCLAGIFNSMEIDLAKEISNFYPHNCHVCLNSPCTCSYTKIKIYRS